MMISNGSKRQVENFEYRTNQVQYTALCIHYLTPLLHYDDCDPWRPGLLNAWEEIKDAIHLPASLQRAETKALNRTATDQSQIGEGCFCPSDSQWENGITV